jgi:hypothetical protein
VRPLPQLTPGNEWFGMTTGHAEAMQAVAGYLETLEPE